MAAFKHGVYTSEQSTSLATSVPVESGITFAVGTAPVYMTDGNVNKVIYTQSLKEAVEALGNSSDFETFTLCEVINTHYTLYGVSPVVFVNVFDPTKHKSAVTEAEYPLIDGRVELSESAIIGSVVVKATAGGTALVSGTDYNAFYANEHLVIEKIDGGAVTGTSVFVEYDKADISKVTKADIIGGVDVNTGEKSGLELISTVYSKYGIVPELIIAPGFSDDPAVAAIMATKAGAINGIFKGKALIDADCKTVKKYSDVFAWKSDNNINDKNQIVCWPAVALGGVKYHLSAQLAALMASVDGDNDGIPSESPSNKALKADSTVLADSTEIVLEQDEANVLNGKGIATAINSGGRFVFWGNETACYPVNTDVKDYFICINRMFGYEAKRLQLQYASFVDKKLLPRMIDTIVDSENIALGSLVSGEHILGGRIEYRSEDNPVTNLMAGILVFHIYIAPASPAKEIDFTLEYDVNYVSAALS